MAIRAVRVALLAAALSAVGCGTVANLAAPGPAGGGKVPFGGVHHDLACVKQSAAGDLGPGEHARVGLMLICAADLPLSFIGDLVTWPYTATYTAINEPIPPPPLAPAAPPPGTAQAPAQPLPMPRAATEYPPRTPPPPATGTPAASGAARHPSK